MKAKPLLIFSLLSLYGCMLSDEEQYSAEQPALLITPSSKSVLELQAVTARLLEKEQVLIAESAFTKHSELTIERLPHKSKDGQLIMGRSMEVPYTLQLIIKSGECFLKDKLTGKKHPLTVTQCVIE